MNFTIGSIEQRLGDLAALTIEELESELFSLMVTAGFTMPPRVALIQAELDKRRNYKINISAAYGSFGAPVAEQPVSWPSRLNGGLTPGELAWSSASTHQYKSRRLEASTVGLFPQPFLDQMHAVDSEMWASISDDINMSRNDIGLSDDLLNQFIETSAIWSSRNNWRSDIDDKSVVMYPPTTPRAECSHAQYTSADVDPWHSNVDLWHTAATRTIDNFLSKLRSKRELPFIPSSTDLRIGRSRSFNPFDTEIELMYPVQFRVTHPPTPSNIIEMALPVVCSIHLTKPSEEEVTE